MDRIRFLLKKHGYDLTKIAEQLGNNYSAFNKKINKPTLKTLQELSEITGIPIIEFLNAPEGFYHSYDQDGNWKGILKEG